MIASQSTPLPPGSRDDANEPADWSTLVDLLLMVVGLSVAILDGDDVASRWQNGGSMKLDSCKCVIVHDIS